VSEDVDEAVRDRVGEDEKEVVGVVDGVVVPPNTGPHDPREKLLTIIMADCNHTVAYRS
jgi:hypothetical protein